MGEIAIPKNDNNTATPEFRGWDDIFNFSDEPHRTKIVVIDRSVWIHLKETTIGTTLLESIHPSLKYGTSVELVGLDLITCSARIYIKKEEDNPICIRMKNAHFRRTDQ